MNVKKTKLTWSRFSKDYVSTGFAFSRYGKCSYRITGSSGRWCVYYRGRSNLAVKVSHDEVLLGRTKTLPYARGLAQKHYNKQ